MYLFTLFIICKMMLLYYYLLGVNIMMLMSDDFSDEPDFSIVY